jgi:hypothetical protein
MVINNEVLERDRHLKLYIAIMNIYIYNIFMEDIRNPYKILFGDLKGRRLLEDQDVDGSNILKLMLNK